MLTSSITERFSAIDSHCRIPVDCSMIDYPSCLCVQHLQWIMQKETCSCMFHFPQRRRKINWAEFGLVGDSMRKMIELVGDSMRKMICYKWLLYLQERKWVIRSIVPFFSSMVNDNGG